MLLKGKTKEEVNFQFLLQEEKELLKYLKDTDWYVTRNIEQAKAIPEDIKQKRNDARERISLIRENNLYLTQK